MSIATYAELQTAVADYLARSDLTARIPDFIALAEARFKRSIRVRDMETNDTIVMSAGSGTLPANYLEWKSAQWMGDRSADLRYVEPDSEDWQRKYRPNGDPTMFTIMGSTLKIRPVLTGNVTLFFYQMIPALVSSSTNWLLTRQPDLYVNASLAEAYRFLKDEKRVTELVSLVMADIRDLVTDADSNKAGRRPLRASEVEGIAQARNPMTGAA